MTTESFPEVFFELHRDLPREGPGDDESTLRALAMCTELPAKPDILDVGCGPGMQTIALARATEGTITAVDFHEPFLDQVRERAEAAGVRDRIQVMRADMTDLPFGQDSFDLIWSEGAIYIMGVSEALEAWNAFLRPCGYLVFSEATWLVPDPPAEVRDFWAAEYPGMRDVEGNLERIRAAGYEVIGHFTLPAESWWPEYQTPLEEKIPALRQKYAGDEASLHVLDETLREHGFRRDHPDSYGYEFYVARSCHPDAARAEEEPATADESQPAPADEREPAPSAGQPPEPPKPEKPEYPPPLA